MVVFQAAVILSYIPSRHVFHSSVKILRETHQMRRLEVDKIATGDVEVALGESFFSTT